MKISNFILNGLFSLGVDKIFGVNGGLIEPLLLSAHQSDIEIIHCGSENQAALIAQSYGYEKNNFGVCFCISGAGQSSLINGLTTAYIENKKLLVISGDNSTDKTEKRNLQNTSAQSGVSFSDLIKECTVYSKKATIAEDLPEIFNKALSKMERFSRPVHIEIPKDLFDKNIKKQQITIKKSKKTILKKDLSFLGNILKNEKSAFFCSSPLNKKSLNILLNISKKYNIPIYETPTGKGSIPKSFIHYKGNHGLFCKEKTKHKMKSDCFNIFIGESLNEMNTNGWNESVYNDKTILLTELKSNVDVKTDICKNIVANINDFIQNLEKTLKLNTKNELLNLETKNKSFSINFNNESKKVNPKNFFHFFQENNIDNSISFFDNGNSMAWGINTWEKDPVLSSELIQSFRLGIGISSMGWGLGYAIGAAMAHKNNDIHVYCFIGDGSILMSSQEIAFFNKYQLPITFVILNDSSLGMVYHGQKLAVNENFAYELPECNFKKYFEACGVESIRIKNDKELITKKEKIVSNSYKVIDLVIDKEISPPIAGRVKNLKGK